MKKSKLLVLTALIVVFMLSFGLFTGCNLQPGDLSQSKPTEEISETDTTPETEQPSEEPSEEPSEQPSEQPSEVPSESESESEPTSEEPEVPSTTIPSGNFTEAGGVYTSTLDGSILLNSELSLSEGTYSATMTLASNGGDNGLVFGLENPNQLTYFWETSVSYYFFFISSRGTAYLGRVDNADANPIPWTVCGETSLSGYLANGTYTLSVSLEKVNGGTMVKCFVDGTLYVSYKDTNPLTGTQVGIRAGKTGVSFKNMKVTDEILGTSAGLEDYYIANGDFSEKDGKITAETGAAIAVKKEGEFSTGTLEVTMTLKGEAFDNGIVFNLTGNNSGSFWEAEVSYYFFFISKDGWPFLGKVSSGTWSNCSIITSSTLPLTGTYTLKIVKDETTIYGYINNTLYISYEDSAPLIGTEYGFRAGSKGVVYSNLVVDADAIPEITDSTRVDAVSGKFLDVSVYLRSAAANSLGILKDTQFTAGEFKSNITATHTKEAGIVFGYSKTEEQESYYKFVTIKDQQKVKLFKVVNGTATELYSNYLSAGYGAGAQFTYRVILEDGKAYCYFWKTLYTVIDMELTGTGVGFYAGADGSLFSSWAINQQAKHETVDTLLFGHSYFELWNNYKQDLAHLDLGTYTNIGIGGSIASHWLNFADSVIAFKPTLGIYMIGINDLTGGTSPATVTANVKELLLEVKEAIPEFEIVLISVNHCNARTTIKTQISETNKLYQKLAASYDWIWYAEVEYAYCNSYGEPMSAYFTDGLHPTVAGYSKIVQAIDSALKGENQPTLSEEDQAKLLAEAKAIKLCSLTNYSENAIRSAEWVTAKPIYNLAVEAINNCTTVKQVEELDLSSYINQLKVIKNHGQYSYEELKNVSNCTAVYEEVQFKNGIESSDGGAYHVVRYGHRVNKLYAYTDMTFNFRLSGNNGPIGNGGVIFRAVGTSADGLNGYLINYVTDSDYLQIWYMNNSFQRSGSIDPIYIGGWVFPGQVENTLFRAIVKDGYIYLYTEEDYVARGENAYGCSVDLTNNGKYAEWTSGGYGVHGWTDYEFDLEITNIAGSVLPMTEEEIEAQQVAELKATMLANLARNYPANRYAETEKTSYEAAYEQVKNAINSATTLAALNEVSFQTLNAVKEKADYFYESFVAGTNVQVYEDATFSDNVKNSTNGLVNIGGYGHRLNAEYQLTDFSFTYRYTGTNSIADNIGILFRATQNEHKGVNGYLLNYNFANNFVQVFYLNSAYGTVNPNTPLTYIGGWVFPGKVAETEFRAIVKGNTVDVYTEEGYASMGESAAHITVDLTGGGQFTPYASGYLGMLSWNNTGYLAIDKLCY